MNIKATKKQIKKDIYKWLDESDGMFRSELVRRIVEKYGYHPQRAQLKVTEIIKDDPYIIARKTSDHPSATVFVQLDKKKMVEDAVEFGGV